jgi:large subunit ribosomal protein L21
MEKYAVVKLGARQYVVRENDVFEVEKQDKPLKAEVLFYSDGNKSVVGNPILKDVVVKMSVVSEKRDAKIMVGRFKSKSRYKKKKGHRQELTVVRIDRIHMTGEKEGALEIKASEKTQKIAKITKKTPKQVEKKPAKTKRQVKKESKKLVKKLTKKVKK